MVGASMTVRFGTHSIGTITPDKYNLNIKLKNCQLNIKSTAGSQEFHY